MSTSINIKLTKKINSLTHYTKGTLSLFIKFNCSKNIQF